MVSAVVPKWHGDNYQSRIFWEIAMHLLDPESAVIEVTFEADGPKAFDDVVVKYSPGVARSLPERISTEYHQVKWHVKYEGRFGYEDLINPEFINAKVNSLLQRLKQARNSAPASTSLFTFITIDRIKDGDPLASLISGNDKSLLIEKLFDGTTDASRMGKVRKLWREHLELSSDIELVEVITGLRIFEGHHSLEQLRSIVNDRAKIVGLSTCATNSSFKYDDLAKQLKARNLNSLTREAFRKFCIEEGLFTAPIAQDKFTQIAIRSFSGTAGSIYGASEDNTLMLTSDFRNRYLIDGLEWQHDVAPKVKTFLGNVLQKFTHIRLILDAHASIAFLSGSILNTKTGVEIELLQKGRIGLQVWNPQDKRTSNVLFELETHIIGSGDEIAIAVNVSQDVQRATKNYVSSKLPNVGKIYSFTLPGGASQQNIAGGEHAVALAEQLSNCIRNFKEDVDSVVHIFAACPNALLFFLGQQSKGISPCIIYEYDFDRENNKSYHPSFVMT